MVPALGRIPSCDVQGRARGVAACRGAPHMTPLQVIIGVLVGFVAGMGSGLFGVGGGTVTTPAIDVLLGGTAIQAVATPLPVMFPTSVVGAITYGRAGEVSLVPAFTTFIGMPLKRALGTSLVTISALVVPGTIVHAALGHIDWAIFLVLTAGVIPGARVGAKIALGAKEGTLRVAVGAFLLAISVLYGVRELASLVRGPR